jgi:heterodisulfide reductase subunit A
MNRKIGSALVVGAGIGGIRAALDLAEIGYGVTLVDRGPFGGILSRLDRQFPNDGCGMCRMLPLFDRSAGHPVCLRKGLFHENIDVRPGTRVVALAGQAGRFTVTLRRIPTGVDPAACVGCGLCARVCPVEAPADFNAGLSARRAIYLPVPHQIPNAYVVDPAACTRCGACVAACPTGAIDLAAGRYGRFRILVVDDETIVRESVRDTLVEEGFLVEAAASGAAALERLEAERFHLMATDIKMPGMDGVELLQAARARHPELAVVMMTAYATVETAVEALKIGAADYLVKPFDPAALVAMAVKSHEAFQAAEDERLEVGAVVLSGGTGFYEPGRGRNLYGHGRIPHVLTGLEFERLLSGTGPTGGRLVRPADGRPVSRIAWLQCVGSRDLQLGADFCSSICCMASVKEAVMARQAAGGSLEAVVFAMDLRGFGKSHARYLARAQAEDGVRVEHGRIHSVTADPVDGSPVVRVVGEDGALRTEAFDLLVLAAGERPAAEADRLAQAAGLALDDRGFVVLDPFNPVRTAVAGVVAGGAFGGLKDIGESVIHASAAAAEASRVIHAAGGSLALEAGAPAPGRDVGREIPRLLVALCTCQGRLPAAELKALAGRLEGDRRIAQLLPVAALCTADGWQALAEGATSGGANRLLVGACHPHLFARRLRALAGGLGLDPALAEAVPFWEPSAAGEGPFRAAEAQLRMGIGRLFRAEPASAAAVPVVRRALVIGGGIAGMTAALAIADHGYPVVLVERESALGGNLRWLARTADGNDPRALLAETAARLGKHPNVRVLTGGRVLLSRGAVGRFATVVESAAGAETIEHGAAVLATGGREAPTRSYGHGELPGVLTQKALEEGLASGEIDPAALNRVVMIQCVDSREEPRGYCSRICCLSAMKHALHLKEKNPEIDLFVLYRDIMTYGVHERFYTAARRAGVVFIRYAAADKPRVARAPDEGAGSERRLRVAVADPILGRPVAIAADLVVLATGVVPELPAELAGGFGAGIDADGFFAEADPKWRPVDGLRDGVFACGLALGPRTIAETVASAGAAAARALRILARERIAGGLPAAGVRPSLCSLCERCIAACPCGARALDPDGERIVVHAALCQGCGACAAACPNGAAVLEGLRAPQILDTIEAALAAP